MKKITNTLFHFILILFYLVTEQFQTPKVLLKDDLMTNANLITQNISCKSLILSQKFTADKDIAALNLASDKGMTKKLYVETLSPLKDQALEIYADLIISDKTSTESIETPSTVSNNVALFQLVEHDNFETKNIQGWNFDELSSCDNELVHPNTFLGGHCKLSSQEISKTYSNLPPHQFLRVSAKFHMFDNWNGEFGYMKLNDQIMWLKNGVSPNKAGSLNLCGSDHPDPAYNLPVEITIPHSEKNVKVSFGSSLKADPCSASYGVDDITLYVK